MFGTFLSVSKDLSESQKYKNSEIEYSSSFGTHMSIVKAYITTTRDAPVPKADMPIRMIPISDFNDTGLRNSESQVYRLGHSSVLLRLDGEYVLTDPVFSKRASPFQWIGPKRFHEVPIDIETLPAIKTVLISHDHYDHLDKTTIKALGEKVERFVVPMGVGNHLRKWGIRDDKIVELKWWQEYAIGSHTYVSTPAQHFSGRGILDKDKTLWSSWVIQGQQAKLFYSGDTGYFNGFKEIGERYGPFDMTMIETGAYNQLWPSVHMLPEQSIQAHIDLRGNIMLPVHNGTFDLALHDWSEPFERVYQEAETQGVKIVMPIMGEGVSVLNAKPSEPWWRSVDVVNRFILDEA